MSARSFSLTERLNMLAGVANIAAISGGYDWGRGRFEAYQAAELASAPKPSNRLLVACKPLLEIGLFAAFCIGCLAAILGACDLAFGGIWNKSGLDLVIIICGSGLMALGTSKPTLRLAPAKWLVEDLQKDDETIPTEGRLIMETMSARHPGLRFRKHVLYQDSIELDPGLEAVAPDGSSCIFYVYKDGQTILPH